MGDQSFMAAAPRLWNSLLVDIRSACTISDFKQKLKTFYFLLTCIFLTHRGCFLSSCHKLFIPPNHHIRKIGDKEEDTATSRSNVCSGKKHRDQETQHDCSDHKHKQEKKNDDWVAVPQNLSTFQDSNKQRDCDDH